MERLFPKTLNHLLWIRFKGKLRRWLGSFQSPRRRVMALIAFALGVSWVSQAVVGILFRKAAEHQSMVRWSAGMDESVDRTSASNASSLAK